MGILSIQSQVAAGFVGNSAAVFALQRLKREVWALPTVLLSHHPGHGGAQGGPMPVEMLRGMLQGLAGRGCFLRCAAVLSGYLGQAAVAAVVIDAVAQAKAGMPAALYLCDPVLGDDGRLYVGEDIVARMRELVAMADIVSPNAFELGVLRKQAFDTRQGALQAMRGLQAEGPGMVLLSSFAGADTPAGTLDVMALEGQAAWRVNVPDFARKFYGAGDLFAGVFLDAYLRRRDLPAALGEACSGVQAVLRRTAEAGADELLLVESQDLLAGSPVGLIPERVF